RLAFRHHHGMVFATAHRILGEATEAEDVTQTVFEILARKLPQVRDPARLPGFLKTCAVRESLATLRWRRRRRLDLTQVDPQISEHDDPRTLAVVAVKQLLDRLEPVERAVVVLKLVERMSWEEVAEALETSVSPCGDVSTAREPA